MGRTYFLPVMIVMLVDWLLLRGTDMLFGVNNRKLRSCFGALLGGIQAAFCLLPGFSFLNSGIWRLIVLICAGCVAFDMDIHRTAIYCLLNMGIGGLVISLGKGGVIQIVFAALLVFALCFIGLRGRPDQKTFLPIKIPAHNGTVSIMALVDTGNWLRDPITGRPVMVVSASVGSKLLGKDQWTFSNPTQAMREIPGSWLLPYNTVAGSGFMLVKKFEKVTVGNRIQDVLIAFSPMEIGKGKGFDALA